MDWYEGKPCTVWLKSGRDMTGIVHVERGGYITVTCNGETTRTRWRLHVDNIEAIGSNE